MTWEYVNLINEYIFVYFCSNTTIYVCCEKTDE